MVLLYSFLFVLLLISFYFDRKKTKKAIKIAWKGLLNLLPPFLQMIVIASVILFFVPESIISQLLGNEHGAFSILIGGVIGSIALIPGFVAYPLAAISIENGASYMASSAFVTTLMMVGIVTYPIEKKFFGKKVTIIRNIISFFIAIIIALVVGLLYGEIL